MKARARLISFAALLLAVTAGHAQMRPAPQHPAGASSERASFQPRAGGPKYASDRLIVRFRPGTPKFRSEAAHAAVKARVVRSFKAVRDLEVVRLAEGTRVEAALRAYRKDPTVLYAEPDYVVHALQNPVTPNDPRFSELWGLQKIQAPQAWGITTGSPQVVVAVIDTGIDYNHEDLSANMFRNSLDCNSNGVDDDGNGYTDDCYGIDAANGDSDPIDDNGHGTHVSGTIGAAGNNGIGVVGVNWQVKIIACKFLDANGYGYDSDAITCLDYVAALKDAGVNVVATNNSWGGGDFSQALYEAIDSHRRRGILFVAAAGNASSNNDTSEFYPANYYLPNIIAVGATDRNDRRAGFSNFGRHSVHLGAPGVDILSTTPANTYSSFSGTSMATPHVTGVAALLAAQDPARDWKAIKNLLLAGGDSHAVYWESVIGDYRLNSTVTRKHLNAYGAMACSDSTVLSRLQPRTNAITSVSGLGLVNLAVLHINCGAPGGNVIVLVDGGAETITLLDDGQGTDQEAGDGIYSGQWVPPAGNHTLTIPNAELDLDTDAGVVVDDVISVQILSPYRFSTDAGFNYRQIAGIEISLDDDDSQQITPGFPVLFGGSGFDRVFVNSNGNITFTGPFYEYFNQPLPATYTQTLVAPFWDDLSPPSGSVFWDVLGSAPNRELVIEWRDVPQYDCQNTGDTVRFQVVLFEGSSDIVFNYADASFGPDCEFADLGGSTTVGVQVAPQIGTQYSFNTPSLADNMAILWTLGTPTPAVTRLSPVSAIAGDPGFPLHVFGSDFVPQSEVQWNGSARLTVFASSAELTATIPASDLAVASTVQVRVSSPEPGGGTSNELLLTVYNSYPVPSLTSISPSQVIASGCQLCTDTSFTLNVTGTDFVSSSVVRWNGADRPTTILSATQVQAEIPFADVADSGSREITVFTPAPGGGVSNPLSLAVENPVPSIAWVSPAAVAPGVGFTLTVVSYSTFVPSSVVRWNGADRPTTFVTADRLDAAIPASDLPSAGTAEITVFTPTPGGGISNAVPIEIVPRPLNDDFANALAISALPFTQTVDVRTATVEPADLPFMGPGLSGGCILLVSWPGGPVDASASNTVWYKFTPETTMTVRANMIGTNYHAYMAALTGAPGSLNLLRCTQSTWSPPYNEHEFTAQAGQTYYFVIGNSPGGAAGTLVFNLSASPPNPLTVTPSGSGAGTVTSNPAGIDCGNTCSALFPSGSVVTLTATPANGSMFVGWGGACSGAGTCTVTMDAARNVTATFDMVLPGQFALTVNRAGSGAGTVTSNPAGIDCGATCSASFPSGSVVTLTATPVSGSVFAGWSGNCSGTGTCVVTMDAARSETATFNLIPQFTLTVSKTGTGTGTITSTPAGIDCGNTCSALFPSGSVVTLSATPASGSMFVGWSGACTGAGGCSVTMDAAKNVTATFDTVPPAQFVLTVNRTGTGSGTVTSSPPGIDCGATCTASFQSGAVVTLTATPASGSVFVGWSGDCSGAGTCTVTMDAAKNVTATFDNFNPSAPWASLSMSSLTFAPQIVNSTSAAQSVTLTNTGGAPLTISSMTLGGPAAGHFAESSNCGTSLNAGASCTINVSTRPTEAGPCAASLAIADNAAGSPHTITLSGMATDFSVTPASGSTTSATVNAGQAATYSLNLAGTSGFNGSVGLACSGAPNAATCTVSPSTLTLNGTTPVVATVTINTTARAALPPLGGPSSAPLRVIPLPLPALLALTALLFFAIGFRSRRYGVRASAFAATAVLALLLLGSCGGGDSSGPPTPRPPVGTQPGTYAITVTATSAGASRTLPLTLTVR